MPDTEKPTMAELLEIQTAEEAARAAEYELHEKRSFRLECLRLALSARGSSVYDGLEIGRANSYAEFVLGE